MPRFHLIPGRIFSELVETGESRTLNTDHSVAAALRELSICLARLADALDQTTIPTSTIRELITNEFHDETH